MKKVKPHIILSFGEILLDVFPSEARVGGAPANFARYCAQFGAKAYPVSAVGKDKNGKKILDAFKQNALSARYVQTLKNFPTGTVHVTLNEKSVPSYKFLNDTAYDNVGFNDHVLKLAKKADVIYFGTLAQRSKRSGDTLKKIISASAGNALIFVDVNLRQNFFSEKILRASLKNADILKISLEEMKSFAKALKLKGGAEDVCRSVLRTYKLKAVVFTKAEQGSVIFTPGKEYPHKASSAGKIKDTVGAGDAFAAAFCIGYMNGISFENISRAANKIAAYVCTKKGATVNLPEKLKIF